MLLQPTFRDPDGICFPSGDRVLRLIHLPSEPWVRELLGSSFIRRLVDEGHMPRTRVLSGDEVAILVAAEGSVVPSGIKPTSMVLEHERITFPSYPHEWCAEMLHAAGELTLEIHGRALEAGLQLKDATPGNILFDGARPVFVDLLSFSPRPAGTALWMAYAQFVRTFLLPLMLHREQGIAPHSLFLTRRDGVEPEEVYSQLSFFSRLGWSAFQFVTLPTWFGRHRAATEPAPKASPKHDDERAAIISRMVLNGLRRSFRSVRPHSGRKSGWSDYETKNNYRDDAFSAKETFVRASLARLAPRTVLDLGCNMGHFSALATEAGAAVVAIDYDAAVVGRVWQRAQSKQLKILPLVLNLASPTPGLGWRNAETASFLARAVGRFDVALLLAVIHHLTVTDGVPLPEVFRLVAELVGHGAIVEYVPTSDSMFRKIARNKEHLLPHLQRADFEAAFAPWFSAMSVQEIPGSGRVLYCLEKKRTASA